MSEKLFFRGKNEETLLPRVLRVFAQQGLEVKELSMHVENDELLVDVSFSKDVSENVVKVLTRQLAVDFVDYTYQENQAV